MSGAVDPCGPRRAHDARCACGSLLARLTAGGVELKCRRCKRIVIVPWTAGRRVALHDAALHERNPP